MAGTDAQPQCDARVRSAHCNATVPLLGDPCSGYFIATDPATGTPTELEPVAGSPEDFREAHEIGERIDDFANTTKGYQTQVDAGGECPGPGLTAAKAGMPSVLWRRPAGCSPHSGAAAPAPHHAVPSVWS